MNARELTIKTITENGYIIGKMTSGKGTEILEAPTRLMSSRANRYSISDENIKKDQEKIKEIKEKYDLSELYVNQFYLDETWYNPCEFDNQHMKIEKFFKIYEKEPHRFATFSIYRKSQVIGHLPLSKYKSTKDSQIELCKDLLELSNINISGEIYDDSWDLYYSEEKMEFKSFGDFYSNGDYFLSHGHTICQDTGDCDYFDGRMENYNDSEMEIFEFDEGGYLKEIDPDETISVYARKGKDWYSATC